MSSMRAIACKSPDRDMTHLSIMNAPLPEPGKGQVRIAVQAASLNPVDWKLVTGVAPWWIGKGLHYVGLDGAGVVEALGEGVHQVVVGDRVMWHADLSRQGVLADFAVADAHVLSRIPTNVSFQTAAAFPCAGMTAYQALVRKARISAGQTILVQGAAGSVGGFAIQIAKRFGAQVIALARGEQEEGVRALGADHVLDRNDPALAEKVRELTGGYGADVMLEVANPGDARRSLDLIHYNGHLLCVDPLPDLTHVSPYTYAASIHEVALGGAYAAGHRPTQEDFSVMGAKLLEMSAEGRLDPLIDKVIRLEEAVAELKAMRNRSSGGKIIVDIGGKGP